MAIKPIARKPIPKSPAEVAEEKRLAWIESERVRIEKEKEEAAIKAAAEKERAEADLAAYQEDWAEWADELPNGVYHGGLDSVLPDIVTNAVSRMLRLGMSSELKKAIDGGVLDWRESTEDESGEVAPSPFQVVGGMGVEIVEPVVNADGTIDLASVDWSSAPSALLDKHGRQRNGLSNGSGNWWVEPTPRITLPESSDHLSRSRPLGSVLSGAVGKYQLRGQVVRLDATRTTRGRGGKLRSWHCHYLQIDKVNRTKVVGHFVGAVPYGYHAGSYSFPFDLLMVTGGWK